MNDATLMVCKGFLESCSADTQESLSALLPSSIQQSLEELDPADLSKPIESDLLSQIHPTWIAPVLHNLSQQEIRFCLAGINGNQAKSLKTILGFKNGLPTIKSVARSFIRTFLLKQIVGLEEILPTETIPEGPLKPLLTLSSKELQQLIYFFGLHDLSVEMHQIIETAKLKKITSALPDEQAVYLKKLTKEPLVFKRLFLEEWDGKKESLQKLLQQRGITRLGAALWDSNPQLIWHLTHRLDLNLGARLLKECVEPSQPRAQKILYDQIHQIQAFIGAS